MKMKRGMYAIALLAATTLMSTHTVLADVTVEYKLNSADGSGTQTIRYTDKQHVRLDMSGAGNSKMSMLKLGDKVYSINGKVVQDMSQLAQMMASMGMGKKGDNTPRAPIKYVDTGRTETIAGIRGKVYHFEDNGKQHEVVLGANKNLQDAVLGVVEITKAATGMLPFASSNRVQQDAAIKSMALLRLDDSVRLQSMNTRELPADTFSLPAKPQQMGGMGGLMKGVLGR